MSGGRDLSTRAAFHRGRPRLYRGRRRTAVRTVVRKAPAWAWRAAAAVGVLAACLSAVSVLSLAAALVVQVAQR